MSGWHRDNPELTGTEADPWVIHESYRRTLHHHRDLSDRSGLSGVCESATPEPPAEEDTSSGSTSAGIPFAGEHCDVCGAPVGKHHLSYCDLRGDV